MAGAILVAVLSVAASQERVGATVVTERADIPASVDEVLWWLPSDTETVMVARGPFTIADVDPRGPEAMDPKNALRLSTMMNLPFHAQRDLIGGREVGLSISGARRFRRGDAATGMKIPCDGAEIVVFRDDLGPLGDKLLVPGKETKHRIEMIAGHRVWVVEDEHPDPAIKRAELHYLARPKPNVLVHATDHDYLVSVLDRMAKRAATRAMPADLPEWTSIDPSASFWCIRHYDRKQGPTDPTSPFARLKPAEVAVPLDEQAVGVVVTFPPDEPKTLRLTYLRGEVKVPDGYQQFWGRQGFEKFCQIRTDRPGRVEVSFPLAALSKPEGRSSVMYLLMAVLGHLFIV
jgi:hypothetical protein